MAQHARRAFTLIDAGHTPGAAMVELTHRHWPAIDTWWHAQHATRTAPASGREALATHMPELLAQYDQLARAINATPMQAHALTGWCPPPLPGACTSAATTSGPATLMRTYDYPDDATAMTMLRTHWTGPPIIGQADNIWGLVDGMNGTLAASIAFGGRNAHGTGFGISTIVRYLLTVCASTSEALDVAARLPSAGAYNITLIDAWGRSATIEVGPDRAARPLERPWSANRQQDTTEDTHHAHASGTLERETLLASRYAHGPVDADTLETLFTHWPIRRHLPGSNWGTVYTAAYRLHARTCTLSWPTTSWTVALDGHESAHGPIDPHLTGG